MSRPATAAGAPGHPRALGWARAWWRELSTYRLPLVLLSVVLLGTSGLLMAAPVATLATASTQLHHLLRTAPAGQRDVVVAGTLDPATVAAAAGDDAADPTSRLCAFDHEAAARRITEQMPDDVRAVSGPPTWSSTTRTGLTSSPDGQDVVLMVRAQSGVDGAVEWTAGGLPQPQHLTRATLRSSGAKAAVLDVAVSESVAGRLHLKVGSVLGVSGLEGGGGKDTVPGFYWSHPVTLRVAGIYRARDPLAGPWSEERTLVTPGSYLDGDRRTIVATALVPGEKYQDLCESVAYEQGDDDPGLMVTAMTHQWRVPVRASAEVVNIPTLRKLPESVRAAAESADLPLKVVRAQSSLPTLLDDAQRDAVAAQSVLATFYAALGVLFASSLVLLTLALMGRRGAALRRMAARGASFRQLARVVLVPLAVIGALALAATSVLVRTMLATWPEVWTVLASAAAALVPLPVAATRLRGLVRVRDGGRARRAARLRLAVALTLLTALAALGLVQLRRTDVSTDDVRGIDPFLASVPVVLALTGVALVGVLLPALLRAAAHAARRAGGAVALTGLARAARSGAVALLPLVSLSIGLAFTQLALGIALAAPDARVVAASHELSGRTYVDGPMTPEDMTRLRAVPGVHDAVPVHLTSSPAAPATGPEGPRVLVAEPTAYARVLQDAGLPHDLSGITGVPVPAKAWGTRVPVVAGGAPDALGRNLTLEVGDTHVEAVVAAVLPGLTAGPAEDRPVVVLPADVMRVVAPEAKPTGAFVLADESARAALVRGDAGLPAFWRVQDVRQASDDVGGRPVSRYLTAAVATCAVLAALHIALALVLVLRLTGRARSEAVARLRTMGLTRRQVLGVSLVESLPVGLAGTVAGAGFGYALALLVGDKVNLAAFTGGVAHPGILPPWWVPPVLAAAALTLYALVVVLDAARSRRLGLAATLRMGDVS